MRPRPQRGAGWLEQPRGSRWGRRTLACVRSCRRECCSNVWSWQRLSRWREIPPWSPFRTPPLLHSPESWYPAHLEWQNIVVIPSRIAPPQSDLDLCDEMNQNTQYLPFLGQWSNVHRGRTRSRSCSRRPRIPNRTWNTAGTAAPPRSPLTRWARSLSPGSSADTQQLVTVNLYSHVVDLKLTVLYVSPLRRHVQCIHDWLMD